jgi:polysaccharide pyruvyl transferase WcaK-like protein
MRDRVKSPGKIAFLGNFNSTNFGNEITLHAILDRSRRLFPNAEFICICNGPEAVTIAAHQMTAISLSETFVKSWIPRTQPLKAVRKLCIALSEPLRWIKAFLVLRRVHMLIVPGTGLLTDAYGLRSQGWGPYYVFQLSVIAKMCGCKLLFVSVGAGPIYSNLGRFYVKTALRLAHFRSYRDDASREVLRSVGFRADKDPVYPDLVFGLSDSALPRVAPKALGRTIVGVGLMEYAGKYSVAQPNDEIKQAYLDSLVLFVGWLLAHENDVRLILGDLGDTDIKEEFSRLLKVRLSDNDDQRVIDEPVQSLDDIFTQIATSHFVVATRFHNILLALLLNKPVIAISFHPKCSSLMAEMGLSDYCLDINALRGDLLMSKFRALEANADSLKLMIGEKVERFREQLDEQYRAIFKEM